jgi:hypothetical protein
LLAAIDVCVNLVRVKAGVEETPGGEEDLETCVHDRISKRSAIHLKLILVSERTALSAAISGSGNFSVALDRCFVLS